MESLSALDAEFLHLEDGVTPMHIGGIAVFGGHPPTPDELVALLDSKLHDIPRYRQRVATVPLELGRPVWVDDQHYATAHHVFHTALPAPGDDATLARLVGRLMEHRLDRNRPLWEIWLVEGLAQDRWALVFKVHHCMVDGVAGVGLLAAVLDLEREVSLADPVPWAPHPDPSGVARVVHSWSGAAGDAAALAAEVGRAVVRPATTARAIGAGVRGVLGFGRHVAITPHLSIDGAIGPHRSWAFSSVSIADIKTVRTALGGTVNDVVVACITQGFRHLLEAHGDDPDSAVVRALVPVSVRRDDGQGVPDNRVSALLVDLPVHLTDPVDRLHAVRSLMAEAKASHMSELGEVVTHVADLAPPMALGAASRWVIRASHRLPQRSVTTVCTNVPGPQFPLYCLGREMEAYLPYVPIADGARVGTAILSYNGQLAFGVTGDADAIPDPQVLADGSAAALADLLAVS